MRSTLQQRSRFFALVLSLAAFSVLALKSYADDSWKHKPASEWSRSEVLKILRNSPWAKVEMLTFLPGQEQASLSVRTGTKHCDPDAIDQNGNCLQKNRVEGPVDESRQLDAAPQISPSTTFLVVWQSLRVSQAFARLHQLGEGAVIQFQAEPPRVPADRFVISVKLEQPGRIRFSPLSVTPDGAPSLRALLKTEQGAVTPLETEFTGVGANSAVHFFFPRTLNGTALLGPQSRLADFTLAGPGFAVHAKFKIDAQFLEGLQVP